MVSDMIRGSLYIIDFEQLVNHPVASRHPSMEGNSATLSTTPPCGSFSTEGNYANSPWRGIVPPCQPPRPADRSPRRGITLTLYGGEYT